MKNILAILILSLTYVTSFADTLIQMEEYNGVYRIPCSVNGAKMKFIFDTGASNVCLSLSMAEYLYDNDYISNEDILGKGTSSVADGRIVDHVIINLKDIDISGCHLNNVRAVVIDGQNAPLLMGQSAIKQLGSIELNGSILTIHNDSEDDATYIEQLFKEASSAYDNDLYDRAEVKYEQLYNMNQLSDYGKYRYAWSALMNNNASKALEVVNNLPNFDYFEKEKIDIYRLIGFIYQDLGKISTAIKYYEMSSNKIQTEFDEWLKNLRFSADAYFYIKDYSSAESYYDKALAFFCVYHKIDMKYLQSDSKNRLKKNQVSYRNDEIDYLLYQSIYCAERCGSWSTRGYLLEAVAMAKAGNKYATQALNKAGIDPYDSCWDY